MEAAKSLWLTRFAAPGTLAAARLRPAPETMENAMIDFDNNATTPLDPEVFEVMEPWLKGAGNPSSGHARGRKAREAVEDARQEIADLLGSDRREVVFTSGGTEANNLAIKGTLRAGKLKGRHIIRSAIEHPCVREPYSQLEQEGFEVTVAPVDEFGEVHAEALKELIRPDTVMISVMHANNEIGTVNNLQEIAEMIGYKRIMLHSDAAQSVGKLPTSFPLLGPNLMSLAAHKFHGPKGVGALIVNRGVELRPLNAGGGHESGRRSGTLNVAGIVGMAKALRLAWGSRLAEQGETITALRDYVHLRLAEELRGVKLNGHPKYRLPSTLNLSFEGIKGKDLMTRLDELGVCVSTASACQSGAAAPSAVLMALGHSVGRALSSIRISFARTNTVEEADAAVEAMVKSVKELRAAESVDEASLAESDRPQCPRTGEPLTVMSTSGGLLMQGGGGHLLPLPGTRPPE